MSEPTKSTSQVSFIPLSQGEFAIVDTFFFKYLNQWKWYCLKRAGLKHARRNTLTVNGRRKMIYMHQQLFPVLTKGYEIDHINRNGLDNRLSNLRIATRSQNGINRKIQKNNKSGYRGVSWHGGTGSWQSSIRLNRKLIHLGRFEDRREAAMAYNLAAKEHFGEYARLNLI